MDQIHRFSIRPPACCMGMTPTGTLGWGRGEERAGTSALPIKICLFFLLSAEGTWLLLREVLLPLWKKLVRSKGGEEHGRGKGSNPFSTVVNCSIGLLNEVNHSPKAFAKLALGTDKVMASGNSLKHFVTCPETTPQRWLYPLCFPPHDQAADQREL